MEEMFKLIFETCSKQAKGWGGTSRAEGPAGQSRGPGDKKCFPHMRMWS